MSTTATSPNTGTADAGQPQASRPWQGTVHATLTRVNVDVVETIQYSDGLFTHRSQVVGGPSSQAIIDLNEQARRDLLSQLQAEVTSPPAGTDLEALNVFVDLLDASLLPPPSHRFDTARFGAITHDESTGTLFGHLVLGVDMAGTVHDYAHKLSFEQHLVVLPPGPFRRLSPADRASLARALRANPPPDPTWQQIVADASA
ncbi:MAG: hypothetical protein M3083_04185 [Actinomycetota bacterium]|nr:hypothetical protein [Actinomycetota bacterium]